MNMSSRGRRQALILLMIGALLLVAAVAVGCGGSTTTTTTAAAGETTTTAADTTTTTAKVDPLAIYDGATVTFIVATKPGGGYDSYGRLIAPVLQKHLPGSTVIVENVPGGGHIIGCNKIYASKPDGMTFGTFNKGLIISQLAGLEGIQFDLAKMTWLGNAAQEPRVFVVSTKGSIMNLDDAKAATELKLASAGVGSASHNDALLLADMLGLKVKMIPGYAGQEADLAMMRGEVDGQIGAWDSMKGIIETGDARAILLISDKPLADLPDVPLVQDVAPPEKANIAALMVAIANLSRPIAGPPGMDPALTEALQQAFRDTFADPELADRASKAELPIDFMDGPATAKAVIDSLQQPAEMQTMIQELAKEEG